MGLHRPITEIKGCLGRVSTGVRVLGGKLPGIVSRTQYLDRVSRVHGRGLRLGQVLLSVSLSGGPSLRWGLRSDASISEAISSYANDAPDAGNNDPRLLTGRGLPRDQARYLVQCGE